MRAPALLPVASRVVRGRSVSLRRVATSETAHLLGAALARDPTALGDLLERLRPRLLLWSATRLSPELKAHVDAEDVAQLVLLAIHRDFARFAGSNRAQFFAWVFSIAENRIRDLARHFGAAKRSAANGDFVDAELAEARAEARRFSRTSPSQAAIRKEALDRMHAALATLPEPQQTILRLRELEMRGYDEIVERMKLPSAGAARTLRCRALVVLRLAMDRGGSQ